jgi:hypothetical protein
MALILFGHEESQACTIAFRELGHEAYSCDLKPCSGGHPEWHLQMDVFKAAWLKKWDAAVFFPDCTYMTSSGLFRNINHPIRAEKTEKALRHVRDLMNLDIEHIGIENPVGCISTRIFWYVGGENGEPRWEVYPIVLEHGARKADQTIQPYQFNEDASKRTCLWLKNLPKLKPTGFYPPRIVDGKPRWSNQTDSGQNKLPPSENRAELRSKTYLGIAKAMAEQWTPILNGFEKTAAGGQKINYGQAQMNLFSEHERSTCN